MSEFENTTIKHKSHRDRNAGRKADKKKAKKDHVQELSDKQKNPKAFTFNSAIRAERRFRRKQDIETKKQHIPVIDRTPLEPPPVLIVVVGPPKVGKSLLIQCLIKAFAKQPLTNILGPVTVISGKKRRITFMECNNDINSMIDIAKVADLVLLLIDASFGFEMEIFEFLNICQVHGMPRIMGVLTHLDLIKNGKQMRKIKKTLKHRFWTEVYAGAKLFYLSGLLHNEYLRNEVKNLARFISVIKFRPLTWRTTHPYLLADRVEDLTSPELIRQNPKVDRTISLYGYVRGVPLNKETSIHIPGCGDLKIKDVSFLPDPCPLPEQLKKRALIEKERLIYAPFSGVGGIVYDKDAVYVELGGSHSHNVDSHNAGLVDSLMNPQETLDQKLQHSELQLFSETAPIKAEDVDENFSSGFKEQIVLEDGRVRRKVVFNDSEALVDDDDEDSCDDDNKDDDFSEEIGEQDVSNEINASTEISDDIEVNHSGKRNKRKDSTDKGTNDNYTKKKKMDEVSDSEDFYDELKHLTENNQNNKEEEEKQMQQTYPNKKIDNDIKNKITDALNLLNKQSKIKRSGSIESKDDISDNESFDELSEDDSQAKLEDVEVDKSDQEHNSDTEESEDEEEECGDLKWKSNLAQKASNAFVTRQQNNTNLMKMVYGVFDKPNTESHESEDENEEKDEDIGGIFRVVRKQQRQKMEERELKNQEESMFFSKDAPRDWLAEDNKVLLINRFVTGKWKESEDAEELLKLDNIDDDELYGDFEDLETGEKHETVPKELTKDEAEDRKKLIDKKKKLKEKFDSEYDNSEDKSHYNELKSEVEKQAQLNKSEFEGIDDNMRVQFEGFRPGMYIRIELDSVPCEMITYLDPTYPLIVGGLLHGEENIGYVQTRIKKHRWYSRILKSRDPLILSIGWRRFQTLPIYSKLEDNLRNRMLKYTPEHVSCMGHFWGPITPQGTGVLAVQNVATREPGFRIAATGSIVELDKSSQIVKKLKLTGVPLKIYKKTAFIKDMFNSTLEVAKFEGAKIKTVSGIRGQIKKAISKPEGCFRATFEDKIQLSDIIFCRTWYRIEVPRFYNPVTSLLLPPSEKNQWQGMKTVGQLKREKNIHALANADSLYTPVEREVRVTKRLVIPRSLQKELPYRDKPKIVPASGKRKLKERRVAVVLEPKEEKVAQLMRMIRTTYSHKQKQLKDTMKKRINTHQTQIKIEESKKLKRQRVLKKQIFRELSKIETKNKRR